MVFIPATAAVHAGNKRLGPDTKVIAQQASTRYPKVGIACAKDSFHIDRIFAPSLKLHPGNNLAATSVHGRVDVNPFGATSFSDITNKLSPRNQKLARCVLLGCRLQRFRTDCRRW